MCWQSYYWAPINESLQGSRRDLVNSVTRAVEQSVWFPVHLVSMGWLVHDDVLLEVQ
jgi:hypothetical protein